MKVSLYKKISISWSRLVALCYQLLAATVILLFIFTDRKKKFFQVLKENIRLSAIAILMGIPSVFSLALVGQMLAGYHRKYPFGIEPGSENTDMLSDIAKVSPIIIVLYRFVRTSTRGN